MYTSITTILHLTTVKNHNTLRQSTFSAVFHNLLLTLIYWLTKNALSHLSSVMKFKKFELHIDSCNFTVIALVLSLGVVC